MSDEAALLAAIRAAPTDDAPRLVYADWLDEHGRSDQAEVIRVEQRLRAALARWDTLISGIDSTWLDRAVPGNVLVLRAFPPDRKLEVIRLLRMTAGLGLLEAKTLSETLPARVRGPWSLPHAYHYRADFLAVGAVVDIEAEVATAG